MEPLQRLRNLIDRVDFNSVSATKEGHRAIYNYIEQEVLSPKSSIVKYVPPLEVIVYSIQTILSPTFSTRRIPDLLDLLATAEFYRGRTLDHARDAIVWNNYYKQSETTVITLTSEEETFLASFESQKDSLRKVYMTILTTCCHLDIYLLWTANPPSITNFLIRFNEYFPVLNDYCDSPSPRLFHADLSGEEAAQLKDVGLICCDFTQESVDWATEYPDSQSFHDAFQTAEFRDAFPRPCQDDQISSLIQFFIECIVSAAQGVEEIFADNGSV